MIRPTLLAVALALALIGGADAEEFRVVAISHGDTFTAVDSANRQAKIRLHGIGAPEKNQPFGQAARRALADKIQGRHVEVAAVDRDRYGHTIARVTVDGREINEAQVREGMAWRYVDYIGAASAPRRRPEPADAACGPTSGRCRPGSGGGRKRRGEWTRLELAAKHRDVPPLA